MKNKRVKAIIWLDKKLFKAQEGQKPSKLANFLFHLFCPIRAIRYKPNKDFYKDDFTRKVTIEGTTVDLNLFNILTHISDTSKPYNTQTYFQFKSKLLEDGSTEITIKSESVRVGTLVIEDSIRAKRDELRMAFTEAEYTEAVKLKEQLKGVDMALSIIDSHKMQQEMK